MKEDLLKPRYKVIADWPLTELGIGDILMQYLENETTWRHRWTSGEWTDITINHPESYPHLFKKLEWWEDRQESEMPDYLKDYSGEVRKVFKHRTYILDGEEHQADAVASFNELNENGFENKFWRYDLCLPASKDEYEKFTSKQVNNQLKQSD